MAAKTYFSKCVYYVDGVYTCFVCDVNCTHRLEVQLLNISVY